MQSLSAKDETIMRLNKTGEEKERTLRAQLAELQSKSKQRVADLTSQVEQLQGEVARRMLEAEKLTEALSSVTKANEENKVTARGFFSIVIARCFRCALVVCFLRRASLPPGSSLRWNERRTRCGIRGNASPLRFLVKVLSPAGTEAEGAVLPRQPVQGEQSPPGVQR
jgi:chaperonin cofactor prefoldin